MEYVIYGWLGALILFLVIEIATTSLTTIWFAGVNDSNTHVDFMVGTADLSIIGTTKDGREVPVFVNGNFAL